MEALHRAALATLVAGVVAVPCVARAELRLGLDLGAGGATITSPNDEEGEPTLLAGTAFTGPAFRGAIAFDADVVGPLMLGAEVGIGRYAMNGFAERGTVRRDLALRLTALDVLVRARVGATSGTVRPFGGLLFGPRFGVSATATDTRDGFDAADGAPDITTGTAFVVGLEGGTTLAFDRVRVPVAFRATYNPTYGRTTRDRFDGYTNLAVPGELEVEANWTYGVQVGVAWAF